MADDAEPKKPAAPKTDARSRTKPLPPPPKKKTSGGVSGNTLDDFARQIT
jgi:hypothetical protein